MRRPYLLLMAALAACPAIPGSAQSLQGQSFETVLSLPPGRDSARLWHRYLSDSTVALLMPAGANPWLRRGYEFIIPLGRITHPVALRLLRPHRDSLVLSCTAPDYLSSGYRLLFCRESGSYVFRAATEFQIFRSGVERICRVPVAVQDKPDRRVVTPVGGAAICTYNYHQKPIGSFPARCYVVP